MSKLADQRDSDFVARQIEDHFKDVLKSSKFEEPELWITLYIATTATSDHLKELANILQSGGWVNTNGWEGGFIYPKRKTLKNLYSVQNVAKEALALCSEHHAEVVLIHADTSADVERSEFVCLFQR